jgi:hypothetical protein
MSLLAKSLQSRHSFQLSRNKFSAYCTCGGWNLFGFSVNGAKQNHQHHVAGLPEEVEHK